MATPTSGFFIASGLSEAEEIRAARAVKGITQWQLAQIAQVAPWGVSGLETTHRYVPPSWKRRIRLALGLEADYAA